MRRQSRFALPRGGLRDVRRGSCAALPNSRFTTADSATTVGARGPGRKRVGKLADRLAVRMIGLGRCDWSASVHGKGDVAALWQLGRYWGARGGRYVLRRDTQLRLGLVDEYRALGWRITEYVEHVDRQPQVLERRNAWGRHEEVDVGFVQRGQDMFREARRAVNDYEVVSRAHLPQDEPDETRRHRFVVAWDHGREDAVEAWCVPGQQRSQVLLRRSLEVRLNCVDDRPRRAEAHRDGDVTKCEIQVDETDGPTAVRAEGDGEVRGDCRLTRATLCGKDSDHSSGNRRGRFGVGVCVGLGLAARTSTRVDSLAVMPSCVVGLGKLPRITCCNDGPNADSRGGGRNLGIDLSTHEDHLDVRTLDPHLIRERQDIVDAYVTADDDDVLCRVQRDRQRCRREVVHGLHASVENRAQRLRRLLVGLAENRHFAAPYLTNTGVGVQTQTPIWP